MYAISLIISYPIQLYTATQIFDELLLIKNKVYSIKNINNHLLNYLLEIFILKKKNYNLNFMFSQKI